MRCSSDQCQAWAHLICARAEDGKECPNCSSGVFCYSQSTANEDGNEEQEQEEDEDEEEEEEEDGEQESFSSDFDE